jgi:hypothetical protein
MRNSLFISRFDRVSLSTRLIFATDWNGEPADLCIRCPLSDSDMYNRFVRDTSGKYALPLELFIQKFNDRFYGKAQDMNAYTKSLGKDQRVEVIKASWSDETGQVTYYIPKEVNYGDDAVIMQAPREYFRQLGSNYVVEGGMIARVNRAIAYLVEVDQTRAKSVELMAILYTGKSRVPEICLHWILKHDLALSEFATLAVEVEAVIQELQRLMLHAGSRFLIDQLQIDLLQKVVRVSIAN